jgi:hypothetical protein
MAMSGRALCCCLAIILVSALLGPLAPAAAAELSVFDRVGTVGTTLTLVVRTTNLFLADGGRRVSLFLDDDRLGDIMTGGDGYGYFRLSPSRAGLWKVSARSDGNQASGLLLVLEKTDRAVLVEVETVFKDVYFQPTAREGCRNTLESLRQRYRLIFVCRFMGADFSRSRLAKEGLSPAVVIPWKGAGTMESLRAKEVQVHAAIGSAEMLAAAGAQVPYRISFEKAKGARTVSAWSDIEKVLE